MGWKTSFVGTLLKAAVTSLPELAVTVGALGIGAPWRSPICWGATSSTSWFSHSMTSRTWTDRCLRLPHPHAVSAFGAVVISGIFIVAPYRRISFIEALVGRSLPARRSSLKLQVGTVQQTRIWWLIDFSSPTAFRERPCCLIGAVRQTFIGPATPPSVIRMRCKRSVSPPGNHQPANRSALTNRRCPTVSEFPRRSICQASSAVAPLTRKLAGGVGPLTPRCRRHAPVLCFQPNIWFGSLANGSWIQSLPKRPIGLE